MPSTTTVVGPGRPEEPRRRAKSTAVSMRALRPWVGAAIAVASVAWPPAAVWLSSHQLISGEAERLTSWLCLLTLSLGAACHWRQHRSPGALNYVFTRMALLGGVLAILLVRGCSDSMFTRYTIHRLPTSEWQQIASELDRFARRHADPTNTFNILPLAAPRILDAIGRRDDYNSGAVLELQDGAVGVYVSYGGRNRLWGLAVGPKEFFDLLFRGPYGNWSRFTQVHVATNAVFFVGSDW